MKASEVLRKYADGERNFRLTNLRGQSFKGKDLSGADFSEADIRGTNFTNANLRGAKFCEAKAGLQRRWATVLVVISLLLSGLLGLLSGFAGSLPEILLVSNHTNSFIAGLLGLVVQAVFLLVIFRYGLGKALVAVAVGVVFAFIIAFGGAIPVAGAGILAVTVTVTVAIASAVTSIVAGTGAFMVTVAIAVTSAVVGAFAGAAAVTEVVPAIFPEAGTVNVGSAYAVTLPVAIAIVLLSAYIGWRALKGYQKYAWVCSVAVVLAATGGTSFRGADLTDADFTRATLKSTDFRKATLTRTCWHQAQKLDRVRPGDTYLQNAKLRHLVITGDGENENFDRQDLRDLNLRKANLKNASFIDADFYKANLQEANLSRTILVRTNFERADLRGTNLTGSCIQDWVITESTKLDKIICDYVYLKWVSGDKRDQMPPRGQFKEGGFVNFVKYILDTVELYHEKDINPRLALTVLQKMSRDYDEPFDIVALGKKEERVFIQVKVSENITRENFKEDYYSRYDTDLKLWSGNIHQLPPAVNSFIEKRISEIVSERTDDFVFVDANYVEGNYAEIYQGAVNMSGARNIHTGSGNYNERIEGDYIQQEGLFGIGVNKGEVKAEKIAGTINEAQNEVLKMIESLRQQIEALDNQAVRTEALEYLEDVETEAQSSPKQSRLKSSLMILFNVVKDTALVANAVTALAERLGVQISHLA